MGKMQRLALPSDTAGAAWVSGWLDAVSSCSSTQSAPRTCVNMRLPLPNSTLTNVMVLFPFAKRCRTSLRLSTGLWQSHVMTLKDLNFCAVKDQNPSLTNSMPQHSVTARQSPEGLNEASGALQRGVELSVGFSHLIFCQRTRSLVTT